MLEFYFALSAELIIFNCNVYNLTNYKLAHFQKKVTFSLSAIYPIKKEVIKKTTQGYAQPCFLLSDYCTQVSSCIEEQNKKRNDARTMV